MAAVVIRAEHLGKRYQIGRRRHETIRDQLAAVLRAAGERFRRRGRVDAEARTIWALEDLSFEVYQGETVGIIGRNGAGKSTLLKVLSQITDPTTGYAEVAGRVGSLLEVGTGFHADLTGRENTYLNGAILGMRKAEIDRKFDEIVAFAEIERFIDTPVKHYSSGMYMRLAFAVAAHLQTEILLVDEVLAVGDAAFQRKCLGKMDDVARHGRTVLFISHNMEAIQRLCSRGLLLDGGRLLADGTIADVVSAYRTADSDTDLGRFDSRSRRGTGWALIENIRVVDASGTANGCRASDEDLTFELTLGLSDSTTGASLRGLVIHLEILTDDGMPLVSLENVDDPGVQLPPVRQCTVRCTLPAPTLAPGRYRLRAFLGLPYREHVDEIPEALRFEIVPPRHPWRPYPLLAASGHVCRMAVWACDERLPEGCPA